MYSNYFTSFLGLFQKIIPTILVVVMCGVGWLLLGAPEQAEAQTATTWSAVSAAGANDSWRGIAYDATTTRFVAVGLGTDRVMHSTNTTAWTAVSAVGDNDSWNAITYGAGRFVAVASTTGASSDAVMTSTDGLTWATTTAVGNNDQWRAITYGNGRFVAVGSSTPSGGPNDAVMTSTNGLTWATTSAAGNNDIWNSVAYGNGKFVAVGQSGDRVMYSSDGLTWATTSATGDNDVWNSVTYGNGKFVAVASSSGPSFDAAMMSTDGINWTPVSAAANNDNWYAVTFGNGMFVAVASSTLPSADTIMYSVDGLTWATTTAAGNNDQWRGVTYGNNYFVAVGTTVGDRVMVNSSPSWALTQTGFQYRSDNGSETAATSINGQNNNITWGLNAPLRLRTQVNSTSATATTPLYLQYKQTGETNWHSVGVNDLYPVIIATTSGRTSGDTTSHAITLPTGEAGDLLLVVFSHDGASTSRASTSGWSKLGEQSNTTIVTGAVYYKFDTGNDQTFTITTPGSEESSHIVYRIRNAGVPTGSPSNLSSTNSDPANHIMPAILPHLVIATRSGDAQVAATAAPTGFAGLQAIVATTTAGATTNTAHTFTNASSSNPGTFTSATEQWVSWTIAVPPKATPTTRNVQVSIDDVMGSSTENTSTGTIAWTNPGNGTSSDDVRATLTTSSTTASRYLLFSNYGFTIPTDATITGIDAYIEGVRTGGSAGEVRDSFIRLFKAGTAIGNNLASTTRNWDTVEVVTKYGSSTNLWGTTWTPAEINAHNFGVGISIAGSAVGSNRIANIDHVIMQVYYTMPASIQLSASSFIAAAGASTTAKMITPGSRVTTDFTAGRIADDTNPTLALTVGTNKYTELEWSLVATGTATTGDTFLFRTALGTEGALTQYDELPQLTIGTFASSGTLTVSGTAFLGVSTTPLVSGTTLGLVTAGENPLLYATTTSSGGNYTFTISTSSNASSWTSRSAAGNDDAWYGVTYGGGLFVAVANSGGNRVMTSPDGITWTARTAAGDNDIWNAVTYGNGRFVAVGNSGDRVMYSTDGITWATTTAAGNNDSWTSVTFGNGLFVAVSSGSADSVITSPDGITWTSRSAAGNDDQWRGVTIANGLFVAVGQSGDRVMTSPDGITWTARSAAGDDDSWSGITYGAGMFVAVGNTSDRVMTSPDGITWTVRSAAGNNDSWRAVTYGNGRFVAVGTSAEVLMTSPDGINWTVQSVAGNDDSWRSVTYGNGLFVAVSTTTDAVITAPAGFTGEQPVAVFLDASSTKATTIHTMSTSTNASTNVPLYTSKVFVYHASSTGISNLNQLPLYGQDLDTDPLFTASTTATTTIHGDLITATGTTKLATALKIEGDFTQNGSLDAGGGMLALAGTDAILSGTFTGTSSLNDVVIPFAAGGANWVSQSDAGGDNDWYSVTYGNGRYVAVAAFQGTDRVMYSNDGITWATTTAPGTRWLDVTYGNGLFVAVGTLGNRVMISIDGITWTEYAAAGDDDAWLSVTYGNGLFVAVGDGTDRVMTSPDGITWTARSAAGNDDSWYSVTYGNGLFVATGGFSTDVVVTSPDGITWTARSAAGNDDNWGDVTYGNGLFVATSFESGDNMMTSPDGITWTVQTTPQDGDDMSGITYGNGLFVAVGGRVTLMTSPDGITWTQGSASDNNEPWVDVTYGNGMFVAVGQSALGNQVMTVNNKITFASPVVMQNLSVDKNVIFSIAASTTLSGNLTNLGRIENTATVTFSGISKLITAQATATAFAHLGNTVITGSSTLVGSATTSDLIINSGAIFVASSTFLTIAGDLNQNGSVRLASTTTIIASDASVVTGNVTDANTFGSLTVAEDINPWAIRDAAGNNDEWNSIAYGNGLFVAGSSYSSDAIMTSPDGITWTARSAAGNNDNWIDIVFGNGLFVAVGDAGDHRVMTSPDGINWTGQSAAGNNDAWSSVTYGEGLYVAVGAYGTDYVITSPDGVTWTVQTPAGGNNNWSAVTYGNGRFVAGAGYEGVDRIMYSDNGITWATTTASGDDDWWHSLEYGNGLFVAGAIYTGDGTKIITSPDGITWTARSILGNVGEIFDIAYGNGRFMGVTNGYDRVITSLDGVTWTTMPAGGNNDGWGSVTYGNGRFVAVNGNTTDKVMTYIESDFVTALSTSTSVVGNILVATSTTLYAPTSTLSVGGNFENRGTFTPRAGTTTLSGTGKTITGNLTNFAEATGPDYGLTNVTGSYTYIGNGTTSALTIGSGGTVTAPSSGTLTVAHNFTNNGTYTNNAATTTLGGNVSGFATGTSALGNTLITARSQARDWQAVATSSAAGNNDSWKGVAYGAGYFVAVSNNSTDDIMYSRDGLTWIATSSDDISDRLGIAYGNGRFVTVGYSGDRVAYSNDGVTWLTTAAAGNDDSWSSVTYGNGIFVAVAESGNDRVMYSSDGITWTTTSAAGNNDAWSSVIYGNGRFVAVESSFSNPDKAMYSFDGITWATSSVPDAPQFYGVTYGNGRFVAVGAYTGDIFKYSYDGSTWLSPGTIFDNNDVWTAVTYGNGLFVAVGDDGSVDNVAYSTDGITWATSSAAGNNDDSRAIAYGNGRFVAVGEAGERIRVSLGSSYFNQNASTSNLTISASSTLNASGTTMSITGNYINSGTLTASSSTFVFNGVSAQTATGTLSASSSFNNLTLSNTSGNGTTSRSITFGAPLTVAGTSTINASTSVAFVAGATTSIATAVWQGSSESPIYLRSTATGTPSILTITGNKNISYVNVRDSNASSTSGGITATYSTDSGNNTNWNFSNPTPVWNAADWTLYDTITIQEENIDGDLTDFPVYVNLDDLSSTFWSITPGSASLVGTDIRVTTAANVEVPRELVFASSTLGTGELHFKAPSISSTTDTVFKIWYNGTTTGDYVDSATYGTENVWSNDYLGVWHIGQDGTTTANAYTDSTRFLNHGTGVSMDETNDVTAKVGNGQNFDGATRRITVPRTTVLEPTQSVHYSSWIRRNGAFGAYIHPVLYGNEDAPAYGTYGFEADNSIIRYKATSATTEDFVTSNTINNATWHYLAGSYDRTKIRGYQDGILVASSSFTHVLGGYGTNGLGIGARHEGGTGFNGDVDEVRIASTTRNDAWVKAEYYNQSTSTDFYAVNLAGVVGSSTIADHTGGQVNNSFTGADTTNESLFAFRLTPNSGNATVTEAVIRLSGVQGFNPATTLTNLRLLRDMDNDARYDATDVAVGGAGVVTGSNQDGAITFTTDFLATTSQNYLLVSDWTAPVGGSFMTVSLLSSGLSIIDATSSQSVFGSITSVQHGRNNRGGGGGNSSAGGGAPAGAGNVGGGDTTGGEVIGDDPDFFWPSGNSGSWNSGGNAYDRTDNTYATTAAAVTHSFNNAGFAIPTNNTISGIEVKLELSGSTGAGTVNLELSWNGGSSWTTAKTTPTLTTGDAVRFIGSPSDLWGRSWTASEFSNANFAVRLTAAPNNGNTILLDALQIKVYHTTGGGSSGGGAGGGGI
ncbi:MAG: hypothetical protein V4606_00050 [Patescibacteria group bacterium]